MYKNFEKINFTISRAAKEKKLVGALNRYKAVKHWEEAVAGFIGEGAGKTKAVDFKNGVLIIACLSKEIAYQIRLLAQRIIEALNKLIGKNTVFAIQVES